MTFEEAKKFLKDQYIEENNISLIEEKEKSILIKAYDADVVISEEDIYEYALYESNKSNFKNEPTECSICTLNYRETIVEPLSIRIGIPFRHFLNDIVFGEKNDEEIYATIGEASNDFLNYFRFSDNYKRVEKYRGGIRRRVRRYGSSENNDIRLLHYRPVTIKVYNLNSTTVKSAIAKSDDIINSAIFMLSSLKNLPVKIVNEWEDDRNRRLKKFEFGEKITGKVLPLKYVKYDKNTLSYYQLATTVSIPALKFLAYYQVLEYYFVQVSDKLLYNNLSRKINDIKFRPNERNLDKIIIAVNKHRQETDETKMLKNILKTFIDEEELIEFIKEYEKFLETEHYTKRRTIFGTEINGKQISSGQGHGYDVIAKTVKAIRNALVHSSDRHERSDRYVPFSKQNTEMIEKEIPLMKYLAEKVITANAK